MPSSWSRRCSPSCVVVGEQRRRRCSPPSGRSPRSCSPTSAVPSPPLRRLPRARRWSVRPSSRSGPPSPTPCRRRVIVMVVVAFALVFSGALGGYFAAGRQRRDARLRARGDGARGRGRPRRPRARLGRRCRRRRRRRGHAVARPPAGPASRAAARHRATREAAVVARRARRRHARSSARRDAAAAALIERAGIVYRPAGSIARERALVALVIAVRRLVAAARADGRGRHLGRRRHAAGVHVAVGAHRGHPSPRAPDVLAGGVRRRRSMSARSTQRARPPHARARALDRGRRRRRRCGTRSFDRFGAAFPLRRLSLLGGGRSPATPRSRPTSSVHRNDGADRRSRVRGAALRAPLQPAVGAVPQRRARRPRARRWQCSSPRPPRSSTRSGWCSGRWRCCVPTRSAPASSALAGAGRRADRLRASPAGAGDRRRRRHGRSGSCCRSWCSSSAYTPGAVNFVVGPGVVHGVRRRAVQHPAPQGWRTGLVRVADVAIGAGVSVVVGALLWPRRPVGASRRAFADLLRAGGGARPAGARRRPSTVPAHRGGRGPTVIAADAGDRRGAAALEDLVLEHGGGSSTGRRGRCSSTPGVSESPVTASPAPVRSTRSPVAVDGTVLRWRRRVAPCAPRRPPGRPPRPRGCPGHGRHAGRRVPARAAEPGRLPRHPRVHGLDGAVGLVWVHEWLALVTEQPR